MNKLIKTVLSSVALLTAGLLPSCHAAEDDHPDPGYMFDCAMQLHSPVTSKSSLLWLRYFVSPSETSFEVLWYEPHWLTVRFPISPVTQRVKIKDGIADFRNIIYDISGRRTPNASGALMVSPPKVHTKPSLSYEFTNLRYSYHQMGHMAAIFDPVHEDKRSHLLNNEEITSPARLRPGAVLATHKYGFTDGRLKRMSSEIAEQPLRWKLEKPRVTSEIQIVNGRQTIRQKQVDEETSAYYSGGRSTHTSFHPVNDKTFPSRITVTQTSTRARLQDAVLSNFRPADSLPKTPDFEPDGAFCEWFKFVLQVSGPDYAMSPAERERAQGLLEQLEETGSCLS